MNESAHTSELLGMPGYEVAVGPASAVQAAGDLYLPPILAMTRRLFRAEAAHQLERDPEIDEVYFVISVSTCESVDDIVRLYDDWHSEILSIAGDQSHFFRLVLNVT